VYFANLEGQFVDVTGVPAGEYYLVHRVNADRKLRESDYSNDAASLLIELSWPQGTSQEPSVSVLRGCPNTDSCPGPHQRPPRLTRTAAAHYARTVFERVRKFQPSGAKVVCTAVRSPFSRTCTLRGKHAGHRYSVREVLWYERWKSGLLYIAYSVSGERGRVLVGRAKASAAVAQPSQRFVALDDPPLDDVRLGPVVHEVPRLVGDPLGRLGRRLPAE
jgi:hypothetical protein